MSKRRTVQFQIAELTNTHTHTHRHARAAHIFRYQAKSWNIDGHFKRSCSYRDSTLTNDDDVDGVSAVSGWVCECVCDSLVSLFLFRNFRIEYLMGKEGARERNWERERERKRWSEMEGWRTVGEIGCREILPAAIIVMVSPSYFYASRCTQ